MDDVIKKVDHLLEEIEEAKIEKAEAQGQLRAIKENIKNITGADTIEEAKKIVEDWKKQVEETQTEVDDIITELEEEYEW